MRVQNSQPLPYPPVPLPQTPGGFETLDNPYAHSTGEYSEIRKRCEWHLMPILVFTHFSQAEFHKVDNPLNEQSLHFQNIFQATEQ